MMMRVNMKIFTPKRILIFALTVSLLANGYYFGRQWFLQKQQEYFQAGFNQAIKTIQEQIKEKGEIRIGIDDRIIILVPKNANIEPE